MSDSAPLSPHSLRPSPAHLRRGSHQSTITAADAPSLPHPLSLRRIRTSDIDERSSSSSCNRSLSDSRSEARSSSSPVAVPQLPLTLTSRRLTRCTSDGAISAHAVATASSDQVPPARSAALGPLLQPHSGASEAQHSLSTGASGVQSWSSALARRLRSFAASLPHFSGGRRARRRFRLTGCQLLLLLQVLWSAALVIVLFTVLRPLQLRVADTQRIVELALARPPLQYRMPVVEQQRVCLASLQKGRRPQPHSPRSDSPSWFPAAHAAEIDDSASSVVASQVFADTSSLAEDDFDLFSAAHLATQFVVLYRTDDPTLDSPAAVRNLTRSLIRAHSDSMTLVAHFDSLPGFAFRIGMEGLEAEESFLPDASQSRQQSLLRVLSALQSHPSVQMLSQDREISISAALHSGAILPDGIRRIGAATRSSVSPAADVGVAVLDTGIDLNHPSLNAKQGINCIARIERYLKRHRGQRSSNVNDDDSNDDEHDEAAVWRSSLASEYEGDDDEDDPFNDPLALDDNNHGTHVAGIIGGINKERSIVGVAPGTPVYAVKILNRNGQGSWAHLLCGINWVQENAQRLNIKVASMSLAGAGSNDNACGVRNADALHQAICRTSMQASVLFIAAAGNSAEDLNRIVPAAYPEVLTVTAMADSDGEPGALGSPLECRGFEDDDHVASFSNFALLPVDPPVLSAALDALNRTIANADWWRDKLLQNTVNHSLSIEQHLVSAPGVCIPSTVRDASFGFFSGTSQACPHVTGVVALAYGAGGIPGPCTDMRPILCMRMIVDRALERERQAGLAFGFFPWTTQRATRKGTADTDFVLVDPPVRKSRRRAAWDGRDGERERNDLLDPEPVHTEENPNPDVSRPRIRMRKYFGPLIVAHTF